jgi:FHA domain-containing protein
MTVTLRAVSLNDLPLTQPITAHFDQQGGTIGRADHNTMALPDPERHISRRQAQIVAVGDGYAIRNVGSANPILVRNQPLTQGESAPLAHGDHIHIGGYLLEVINDDADSGDATTITRGRAEFAAQRATAGREPSTPAPVRTDPELAPGLGDLGRPLSSSNPFADLLGEPRRSAPAGDAAAAAPAARLPDDFDPFAPPQPRVEPPRASAASAAAGVFDDLIANVAPASIDDLFGLRGQAAGAALADFLKGSVTAREAGAAEELPTDPLVLFGAARGRLAAPESPPDRTPELHAAYIPPRPEQPAPAQQVEEPAQAAPTPVPEPAENLPVPASGEPAEWGSGDAAALWRAFCEGAGVRVQPPQGVNPDLMRVVGQVLRAAVDGTVQLMAVRSATRHELHAQVTVIRPRENNPLKFSPDGQSALEQLLQPALRGFLPAPAAMTDAMNDLVGHAIGTMAGTRAALEGVLARFSPQDLEAKLVGRSVLDTVLPMNRKAKLWELYLQHYEGIRDEAQDDFHALFGKAFLAAYEQQLDRLRREKQAGSE